MDPVFWYAHNTEHYAIPWVRFGMRANDTRSRNIETLDEIERGAIDFYATVRSLYRQRRNDEILNESLPNPCPWRNFVGRGRRGGDQSSLGCRQVAFLRIMSARRLSSLASALVLFMLLCLLPASAETLGPRQFIESLGEETIGAITRENISEEARFGEFERLFRMAFDIDAISRFVLGRYWRRATKEQQREYQSLFADSSSTPMPAGFRQYSGETLAVNGEREASGTRYDRVEPDKHAGRTIGPRRLARADEARRPQDC